MRTSFEVRSGRHRVAVEDATSPQEALIEYLRARGCRDADIVRLRQDAIAWRGAVFTAAPADDDGVVGSRHSD